MLVKIRMMGAIMETLVVADLVAEAGLVVPVAGGLEKRPTESGTINGATRKNVIVTVLTPKAGGRLAVILTHSLVTRMLLINNRMYLSSLSLLLPNNLTTRSFLADLLCLTNLMPMDKRCTTILEWDILKQI